MKARLLVYKYDNAKDYSKGKHLRFAVVDLDKAKSYPSNFVCLLPTRISTKAEKAGSFSGIFGDKSCEVAKKLLIDALKSENDNNVRVEIERRLKLLQP